MCTETCEDSSSGDEIRHGSDKIETADDSDLGNFLWDALTDYDPLLSDLADLCE